MIDTFYYPDGTQSMRRPKDGETFTTFDLGNGNQEEWIWDDYLEQWHRKHGNPKVSSPTTYYNVTPPCPMDLDNADDSGTPYDGADWYSGMDSGMDSGVGQTKADVVPKCECGAIKCGSNKHSSWCALYTP